MTEDNLKRDDPTKDPKFQRVVQHFLKTPHKPHTPAKQGKRLKPKSQGKK